jgi:hypothetical protein
MVGLVFTCEDDQVQPVPPNYVCTTYQEHTCPPNTTKGVNGLCKCQFGCGEELMDAMGIGYSVSDRATDLGITFVFAVGFFILAYLGLRYINHVKR